MATRDNLGRFVKGEHQSTATEIQPGEHLSEVTEFKPGQRPHNAIEHKPTIVCAECGRKFEVAPHLLKRIGTLRKKYCSKECANRGQAKSRPAWNKGKPYLALRGENHPNWRGGHINRNRLDHIEWKQMRQQVLERDGNQCVDCGRSAVKLDVHHLEPWRIYQKDCIDGLITLCKRCHALREHALFREYGTTMREAVTCPL